jgi:hypothetical protein
MSRYALDCNTYSYTSNQPSSNSVFLGFASHMMVSRKMRQIPFWKQCETNGNKARYTYPARR